MSEDLAPTRSHHSGWGLACWSAVAGVTVCLLLGSIGRLHWAAELFVHYQAQYLVALMVLATAFIVVKSWRGLLVCVLLMLFPGWKIVSLYRGGPENDVAKAFRVVTFNVLGSNDRHHEVMDWLEELDADVVFLCEANDEWLVSLERLNLRYPHRVTQGGRGNSSYALLSKYQVEEARQLLAPGYQPLVKARFAMPQGSLTVIGAHPVPPMSPSYAKRNRAYLRMVVDQAREAEGPALVMGDLNASRWASGLQPLFTSGFEDTSQGFGYQATWMRRSGILAIPIDHVFSRGLPPPIDRWIGPSMGSDHSPVIVEVPSPESMHQPAWNA